MRIRPDILLFNERVRLVHERLEDSVMTATKPLSRTKTHVRCGSPDCDWGTPMPGFSECELDLRVCFVDMQ
jgi:hypothetical protein